MSERLCLFNDCILPPSVAHRPPAVKHSKTLRKVSYGAAIMFCRVLFCFAAGGLFGLGEKIVFPKALRSSMAAVLWSRWELSFSSPTGARCHSRQDHTVAAGPHAPGPERIHDIGAIGRKF